MLQMPSLQLCILKVPSLKAASALLKGSSKVSPGFAIFRKQDCNLLDSTLGRLQ